MNNRNRAVVADSSRTAQLGSAGTRTLGGKLELLKVLVQRDMAVRHKGTALGWLWPLIQPLSQLLVYVYVFAIVLQVRAQMAGMPESSWSYGLWLFAGFIPWLAFTSGLQQASGAVVLNPNLVKKVVFPLGLLPLVPICAAFVESTFAMALLIAFTGILAQIFQPTVFLLPLVWVPQLLLTAGLGYLAAALTVFLRDIPQTLLVTINLWFFITPIIYPVEAVPEALRLLVVWVNPMTTVAELYRDMILVGEVTHWIHWLVLTTISVGLYGLGLGVYRKLRPTFADVM